MKTNPNDLLNQPRETKRFEVRGLPPGIDFEYITTGGLTKRECFAAMAMSGLLGSLTPYSPELEANRAIRYADALIEELNKEYK